MIRLTSLILILLNFGCSEERPDRIVEASKQLPEAIDYNFHVKPILSDKCFACHGPDAQKQKANLRLDMQKSAYALLTSGNGHAVIPEDAMNSQLVQRILSEDKEVMMPPPESNLSLTDVERATLIKWIEQGAEYKPHWAFTKPVQPRVPLTDSEWPINEIDHFILDKLQKRGIKPSPEANREQLIRRVFFDITGLPPAIKDLDRWMGKTNPDYYEDLVDSLLSLSAYGERMASHWLDVARFSDSEGYLDDFHHTFWPYRDWVIKSFNENLPYNKFIEWQIGGDQIPNATSEQILATAFNRNHKQNSEGGIIPEEFRVDYVADRTNTVGTAFMALSVGCARCHDHKYDPFSQENYYQLFSFFNSTIERGDAIFSLNAIEYGQGVPNKHAMNAGPVLPLLDDEAKNIRSYLLDQIEEETKKLQVKEQSNDKAFEKWLGSEGQENTLAKVVEATTVNYLTFDDMKDGVSTDLAHGASRATYSGKITSAPGKLGKAIRSDAAGTFVADGKRSIFERVDPFTISFWINTPGKFETAHVMYNGNNRIQGYRGWDIVIEDNKVHFRLNHAHPYQSLDITTNEQLPVGEWVHFVWSYDGSSDAHGMHLYQNGERISTEIVRNYVYRSTKPYLVPEATVYMPYKGLKIGNRHYDQDFTGGLLDEVHILDREADEFVARYLYDKKLGQKTYTDAFHQQDQALNSFFDLFIDDNLENEREELRKLQLKEVALIDTVQEIMVMGDYPKKRTTYILERGVYDAEGKEVTSDVPESIFPMPDDLPHNRYGLGKWLTHPDHPLTSRVVVNQMWYLMFGRGIVETVEDFGNQGALPTHPELLDWLAVDFQQHGWDLKRLIKQLTLSATYRQSSVIRPDLMETDPENRLLGRGPRYRRSAEMIRDNILAASDLLDTRVGGISVFPYQPDGLWKEVMTHPFFPEYQVDYENGLYRRSIYTFWKRNMPPPNMLVFDASSRAECQVRRQRSSTPLQALVLLNDPQIIEGCRVLAENAMKSNQNNEEAIVNTFRKLTSRVPSAREMQILEDQFHEELTYFETNPKECISFLSVGAKPPASTIPKPQLAAMARVANTILNTTESYYKN